MPLNFLVQMMKNKTLVFSLLLLVSCSSVSGRPKDAPPLSPATNVISEKYLGKWYEIARYPNSFEKNCIKVTAQYSIRKDGNIEVLNSCINSTNNKLNVAKGVAKFVSANNILSVNFAPIPLPAGKGNYYILSVDDNHTYAVVGEPSGKYLWFLSRTPTIDEATYDKMLKVARENSYNTDFLEKVAQ